MKVSEALSKTLFWDVNPENLDWEKSKRLIIERTFVRGGMKDITIVMNKYSKAALIEVLKTCRELDAVTHNFCSHYFNISKTEMYAPVKYY